MENIKALMERRAELQAQMDALVNTADTEKRAMSEDEIKQFDSAEAEIRSIDETVAREERSKNIERKPTEDRAESDKRVFADYIAGRTTEMRAGEQNVNMANNGAVIPVSIAQEIVRTIVDRCPILAGATRYNVPGTLKIPVWGKANATHDITVGYQEEFTDITADAGAFTSVDLSGYLAGALTLIGKSVINSAAVDVANFVIDEMAEKILSWLEGQLLVGTGTKAASGATLTTNTLTAASAAAITADELIALQAQVKQAYQNAACWTMNPDTFVAVKKLKDGNNRYLLQDDFSGDFPYRLLGKPVYLSDNMPTMAAGKAAVLYGDYSGLSVNFRENISIEVLREKYATQHAIGIVSWFEFDSKVTNAQKLAVLKMKVS